MEDSDGPRVDDLAWIETPDARRSIRKTMSMCRPRLQNSTWKLVPSSLCQSWTEDTAQDMRSVASFSRSICRPSHSLSWPLLRLFHCPPRRDSVHVATEESLGLGSLLASTGRSLCVSDCLRKIGNQGNHQCAGESRCRNARKFWPRTTFSNIGRKNSRFFTTEHHGEDPWTQTGNRPQGNVSPAHMLRAQSANPAPEYCSR